MHVPAASETGSLRIVARGNGLPAKLFKRRGKRAGWFLGAVLAIGVMAAGQARLAWAAPAVGPAALPATVSGAAPAAAGDPAEAIAAGAYLARVGGCTACHTAADGQPMAGGLALNTPFGVLYSTNITPDKATGIGNYTFEQFDRVMRKGVAADGHRLYPAMPYPSFAKTTDADMRALYAYLMRGVAPVAQANQASGIHWPYSMRWGLALWDWAFSNDAPFTPNARRDAAWNRGAYLIQGLGHCGACHTPRGFGFQEKTLSEAGGKGDLYLSGFKVESWNAPNLRNLWTAGDLVTLLKTGQNQYGVAAGGMKEVVHNSTQHMTSADLSAMAVYLKSLSVGAHAAAPTASAAAASSAAGGEPDRLFTTRGGLGYVQFCASCHQTDGKGFTPVFPALTQNLTVQASDPTSLIHIILTGHPSPQTQTHPRVYTMPAFDSLSDPELTDILNFVRGAWGSHQAAITVAQVASLRQAVAAQATHEAPAFKTPRLAAMLAAPNAQQLVRGMRLVLQTRVLLPDQVGNALNCTSCHLNGGTVALAWPFVGLASQFPGDGAGGQSTLAERINGCFLRALNGKALPADSDDMKALLAYFDWMNQGYRLHDDIPGRGTGRIDTRLQPDLAHGKQLYAAQCASCHGADGQGGRRVDGALIYPPLPGESAFNSGDGLYTAAAFVKNNMPIALPGHFPLGQGGLSDQDAVDVAAYFSTHARAGFPPKLPPQGGERTDPQH